MELARIREQAPLCRLRFPDSHVGWLATGYAVSRAVLADPRVSSRYELMHSHRPGVRLGELPRALPGDLTGIDPPEHTGYRKKL
ncbi:MAG: cytochrome P450, partial [Kutzneria sp.]|nr:cytochrome P450 [Kutzneria sp.]